MFNFKTGDHVSFVYGSILSPNPDGVYQAVVNGGKIIARKGCGSSGGPEYRVAGFSGWWAEENLVLVSRGPENPLDLGELESPDMERPKELKCDTDENTAVWVWHEAEEYFECSKCRWSALNDYRARSTDSLFCSHCGRKMTNSTMPIEEDEE